MDTRIATLEDTLRQILIDTQSRIKNKCDEVIAVIREEGRREIENTKDKTVYAAKSFMEQATLAMKEHWHSEAIKQKEENFDEKLTAKCMGMMNEELGQVERRIADRSIAGVIEQIENTYAENWMDYIFVRLVKKQDERFDDGLQGFVDIEVKKHIEQLNHGVRNICQSMIKNSRGMYYDKPEVDKLITENHEASDRMVQRVGLEVEKLKNDSTAERQKGEMELEKKIDLLRDEKTEELKTTISIEKTTMEEHVERHILISSELMKNEFERTFDKVDDRMSKNQAEHTQALLELDTALREQAQEWGENLSAVEGRLRESIEAVEASSRDHIEELLLALDVERKRVDENTKRIVEYNESTTRFEQDYREALEAQHCTNEDFEASISLRATAAQLENDIGDSQRRMGRIEEDVQLRTSRTEFERVEDTIKTLEANLAAAKRENQQDHDAARNQVVSIDRRLNAAEADIERTRETIAKSQIETMRPIKEIRAELELIGDVCGQLRSLKDEQREEKESRTTDMNDLRRDLDFVVRPMLGHVAAGEPNEGGNLITTLARTCLDWQQEMQALRERVREVQAVQQGIEAAVKNMFLLHERQVGQYIADHQCSVESYTMELRQAARETMSWVADRRRPDEIGIENDFLLGSGARNKVDDKVQLHEAIREMLTELHRQMSAAERVLAIQIGYVQGDMDKVQSVVNRLQHSVEELRGNAHME